MQQVSLATAKDKFSEYAAAASRGEEIVITRHGKPYAKLVAVDEVTQRRNEREAVIEKLKAYRAHVEAEGNLLTREEVYALVDAQRR
jgi:prevent-host-death family protein